MKKKGSVTVFICLFLAIFIGLIQITLYSVQISGGKVQAIAGVEEGLYSVFAGYERDLFEKYHLFFVDGTYDTAQLNLGKSYHIVKELVEKSCSPRILQLDIRGENLWNCYFQRGEIVSYRLATDHNGAGFKNQAVDYMKDTLGIQGIQLLLDMKKNTQWSVTEEGSEYLEKGKIAQESYEQQKNQDKSAESSNEQVDIPEDFVNPLDVIKKLQKKGILSLVLPLSEDVSGASVLKKELLSNREIEVGIGETYDTVDGVVEDLLFQEYLMTHFNCYTNNPQNSGLAYELEYVIGGKTSDIDNLKVIVTRLIGVREAANIIYLMTDSVRQAELHQMALIICTAIGMPVLEPVVNLALASAWSFGESLLDVRQLLNGGKVPILKSDSTWQLSIEGLSKISELLDLEQEKNQEGISYEQYLRAFLGIQNTAMQVERAMDIVENTMRTIDGKENFRLDCCMDYMEVNMCINCNGNEYQIQRDYGYQM